MRTHGGCEGERISGRIRRSNRQFSVFSDRDRPRRLSGRGGEWCGLILGGRSFQFAFSAGDLHTAVSRGRETGTEDRCRTRAVDHARASCPPNRFARLRLGVGVTDASRRNPAVTAQAAATLHLITPAGPSSGSVSGNGKATSHTVWTGPSRWPGSKKRSPRSARCGIPGVSWCRGSPRTSRCATRCSTCRPTGESGPRSGSPHTGRACCVPPADTPTPGSRGGHCGRKTTAAVWRRCGRRRPMRAGSHVDHASQLVICRHGPQPRRGRRHLNSDAAKAFALNTPAEMWASHGVEHPLGDGLFGRPGPDSANPGRADGPVLRRASAVVVVKGGASDRDPGRRDRSGRGMARSRAALLVAAT